MKQQKKVWQNVLLFGIFLLAAILVLQPGRTNAATAAHTCTVIFISNEGSSVPTRVLNQGTYLNTLPTPTREGYTFGGWYTNEALTLPISSSYYISVSNMDTVLVLYAKWNKVTVSSLVATYSDPTAVVDSSLDRTKIKVTAVYSNGTNGTVTDFTINNLTVASTGVNIFTVTYDNRSASFSVIGIPKQYFTVTFISNGGTNVDSLGGILVNNTIILPPEPTRSGYTFGGWYQDSSLTLAFTAKTPITYNMYAYAKWVKDVIEEDNLQYKLAKSTIKLRLYAEDNVIVESYNEDTENYVTYESSNSSVVSVDRKTGRIRGLKYGNATIYIVAPDGSLLRCSVSVTPANSIKKIKTNVSSKSMKVGSSFTIKTTVSPSSADVKTLKYSTSKKAVATVSASGKVTAKKAGTCYITVKTRDGSNLTKKIKIVVK